VRFAVRPDATFLLLVPVEESLRRARESGRRHVEPAGVLAARLAEYRRLAACGAAEAIDASHAPDHVARLLRERVDRLLVVSRAGRAA
jgi:thymidylate kinase